MRIHTGCTHHPTHHPLPHLFINRSTDQQPWRSRTCPHSTCRFIMCLQPPQWLVRFLPTPTSHVVQRHHPIFRRHQKLRIPIPTMCIPATTTTCMVPCDGFHICADCDGQRGPIRDPHVNDRSQTVKATRQQHGVVAGVPCKCLYLVTVVLQGVLALLGCNVPHLVAFRGCVCVVCGYMCQASSMQHLCLTHNTIYSAWYHHIHHSPPLPNTHPTLYTHLACGISRRTSQHIAVLPIPCQCKYCICVTAWLQVWQLGGCLLGVERVLRGECVGG